METNPRTRHSLETPGWVASLWGEQERRQRIRDRMRRYQGDGSRVNLNLEEKQRHGTILRIISLF